jgi:hypothetical protein
MVMLVSDIITRVTRSVGDTDKLQVTDQDVMRWINDGMREAAIQNNLLQVKGTINTIAGTAAYAFPTDVLKLHSLLYDGNSLDLQTLQDVNDSYTTATATQGVPQVAWIWAGQINLYPVPNAVKVMTVYYIRNPVEVSTTSAAPELHESYHKRLVDYCLAQVAEMDDDMARYQIKMDEFRTGVASNKDEMQWEENLYPFVGTSQADMDDIGGYVY